MASKLKGRAETGLAHPKFVRTRRSDGYYWSTAGTTAFVVFNAADVADYGITATETGSTGEYTANDPADGTEGELILVAAAGASLAESDLAGNVRWTGDIAATLGTWFTVVDASASTTVFKTDLTQANDFFNDCFVVFTDGALQG